MTFCERQQKQFAIRSHCLREPSALHAHQPQLRKVFNNRDYLLGHTHASKAQCGRLLSLDSYKPGKQTVHGLNCHLEKCHKESGFPSTERRNWTRYWRRIVGLTWWLNVWKRKKNTNNEVTFVYRPKMNVHFRFRFVFGRKWDFIFVYGQKRKMLFGRPLVFITKRSWSWSWCKVLVFVLKKSHHSLAWMFEWGLPLPFAWLPD